MSAENWIGVLPALPIDRCVPFVVVYDGRRMPGLHIGAHRATGEDWGLGAHAVNRYQLRNGQQVDAAAIRVDLNEPAGFAFALRLLLRRVANEDRARREWPGAWATAQALWQDYAVQCGQQNNQDRLRLARALAEVFDG